MLREMDSCKSIALDEKGDEHITGFALEGWTMGDLAKFIIEFFFCSTSLLQPESQELLKMKLSNKMSNT